MQNFARADNPESPVIQFVDAQNIINIFDKDRVDKLAQDMINVVNVLWNKAKDNDIQSMNEDTLWRLLELSSKYNVLSAAGRADVCAEICAEMNSKYTHRCKVRLKKASDKQLSKYENLFLQYVSVMSFIAYGDIKSQPNLVSLYD